MPVVTRNSVLDGGENRTNPFAAFCQMTLNTRVSMLSLGLEAWVAGGQRLRFIEPQEAVI